MGSRDAAAGCGLGYADPRYAASLREFGEPVELARCGGWALSRPIPGTSLVDAIGCYPLFCCRDWSRMAEDLADVPGEHVSLTLVTDPFGAPPESELRRTFDVVIPFKDHYLVDLDRPAETVVARHHRKSARKALGALTIAPYEPATDLDTWQDLYGHVVDKHAIDGIRAFSPAAFAVQARIDGLVGLKASLGDVVVGLHWYLTAGDVVYAHLAALHPDSYAVRASHGLFWTAIELFRHRFRWLDLGAAAGTTATATDGLAQFKAGWSSDTAPTYVCGKVLDHDRYRALVPDQGPLAYFPPYRRDEFSRRRPADPTR